MASISFTDYSTVVPAAWLNDVNTLTYTGLFSSTSINLGVGTISPFLKFTAANNTTDGTWAGSAGTISILGLGGYSNGTNGAAQFRYDRSSGVLSVQAGTRDTPVTRFSVTATGQLIGHTNVPWGTNSNGLTLALQGGDASSGSFATNGAAIALRGSATGFNDNGMEFYAGGGEKIRLDSTGLFTMSSPTSALGYGTGSGGAVTQLTNKSTAVTINRGSGKITLANSALAAGVTNFFGVNNSLVSANDTIAINIQGIGAAYSYTASVYFIAAGTFNIAVTNITAGSLSESPTINFTVLKGSIT